ncbi:Ion transport domain [Dillenia turbinata]|uniref:Ion transport domain n=1 Tax=Dillenia turbinata TaxID=194707 RepID=A0AAN8ZFQ5_9MAGN
MDNHKSSALALPTTKQTKDFQRSSSVSRNDFFGGVPMSHSSSKILRFQDDVELAGLQTRENLKFNLEYSKGSSENHKKSFKAKVLRSVFSEDYEREERKILDPRGRTIQIWNNIFLAACLLSLFVDPLFFYLLRTEEKSCIAIERHLEVALTLVRSFADVFYIIQIYVKFRTAYVAPSSRVFGRGELVIDPSKIAIGYLRRDFWIELLAALPLPQILLWFIIPNGGSTLANTKSYFWSFIIFQYIPKLYLIFPLSHDIVKANGVMTETAWAGAAYNLMLFLLASHVIGAAWYLLSMERMEACWRSVCDSAKPTCNYGFFDCNSIGNSDRDSWYGSSNVTNLCTPGSGYYQFGIYANAVTNVIGISKFFNKYFYCLWFGLQQLTCLGQNLSTSTYVGEINFAILIAILGLILFALLIGNMQRFLQSTTVRVEEWRVKRTDTEQWMHHRQLPPELRDSVRKYEQYKWVATRGVDEEALLSALPAELRRDIKRHLCLDLVRQVPLFDQMDDRLLDAICERLKPALCPQGTFLVREGDPVSEMLFIIRGHLDSYTTNGGRTGFFDSCRIGPASFCGEELLTWALDPRPCINLPSSTRTVKSISEVEAFALSSEDLKFVASQFRRLHSKQLRDTFRFYSPQWRSWAACFIQAAWRRFKRRKLLAELRTKSGEPECEESGLLRYDIDIPPPGSGLAAYASRFAASIRRNHPVMVVAKTSGSVEPGILSKPTEPDFSLIDQ